MIILWCIVSVAFSSWWLRHQLQVFVATDRKKHQVNRQPTHRQIDSCPIDFNHSLIFFPLFFFFFLLARSSAAVAAAAAVFICWNGFSSFSGYKSGVQEHRINTRSTATVQFVSNRHKVCFSSNRTRKRIKRKFYCWLFESLFHRTSKETNFLCFYHFLKCREKEKIKVKMRFIVSIDWATRTKNIHQTK